MAPSRPEASLPSSFRDPCGFVFSRGGEVYRQINRTGARDYDLLMRSGLYEKLDGLLVRHEEVSVEPARPATAHAILRPDHIPFITYPYEWAFGQLKDAALLTLAVQKAALRAQISLKDASAFNVQFVNGHPIHIDTLSFESLVPGRPWVAYRQFCQHFVAPLALMATRDLRLGRLTATHIDGVPIDLASALLPARTWWRPGLLLHLHLHAWGQRSWSKKGRGGGRAPKVSRSGLEGLIDSLERTVLGLRLGDDRSTWSTYYAETNYSPGAFEAKRQAVRRYIDTVRPGVVWDLGANTGVFSALAAMVDARTVAFDMDALAVDLHYRKCKERGERRILPLVMDLANPTASIGWNGSERMSLFDRGPAALALALALVHHLAIGNNIPLPSVAAAFSRMAEWVVVEFVPKSDSQVLRMLDAREDVFPDYSREGFEAAFREHFAIIETEAIPESQRFLYLMRRHAS
jgi:hypothetical protein